MRRPSNVRVTAMRTTATLHIEVLDDGPGFDLAAIAPGHGLDNLVGASTRCSAEQPTSTSCGGEGCCVVEMVLPCT